MKKWQNESAITFPPTLAWKEIIWEKRWLTVGFGSCLNAFTSGNETETDVDDTDYRTENSLQTYAIKSFTFDSDGVFFP